MSGRGGHRNLCGGSDRGVAPQLPRGWQASGTQTSGWPRLAKAGRGGRRLRCLTLRRGGGELVGAAVELQWCGCATRRVTLCRRMGTTADLMWVRWRALVGVLVTETFEGCWIAGGVAGRRRACGHMRGSTRRVRGGYLSR